MILFCRLFFGVTIVIANEKAYYACSLGISLCTMRVLLRSMVRQYVVQ